MRRAAERRFFALVSAAIALTVFAGFARTFYLRRFFHDNSLPALLQVHGMVFTAWIALLIMQIRLVSRQRIALHRRVGVFGALLAAALVTVGFEVAVHAAKRDVLAGGGRPPLSFLAIALGDLVVFAVLVAFALAFRRNPDAHKRLMLLATIALLPPALARLPLSSGGTPIWFFGAADVFLLACLLFDRFARGRVHAAFLFGSCFIVASQPLRFQPGARWQYSTAGIDAVGRIVEVASGLPFDQFMQQRLLDPLEMRALRGHSPK